MMKCWILGGSLLGVLCLGQASGGRGGKEENPDRFWFIKARNALSKRSNGVLLTASACVEKGKEAPEMKINWSLDYDGPRPPLIVIQPTLFATTHGQSGAIFYAIGKEVEPHIIYVPSPAVCGAYISIKSAFVTVENGKTFSGSTSIPIATIRDHYRRRWPKVFGDKPPRIFVQFHHKPRDRGQDFGFDAWTGELWSRFLELELKEW